MARTRAIIKSAITQEFIANDYIIAAYGIDTNKSFEAQFSTVSIENILFTLVASAIWVLENLFDLHKSEIASILQTDKAHRLQWYRTQALNFQFGRNLTDEGIYDNTGFTDDEVAASKLIAQAAATEATIDGIQVVRIKVVKGSDSWTQLTDAELRAFNIYMQKIKDAGVKVNATSQSPDELKLQLDIWYDPSILDATGKRVDGAGDTTVQDAIQSYLRDLQFNGEFANMRLVDAIQTVEGVSLVSVKLSQSKYGEFNWATIDGRVIPDSGFFELLDANLSINWREYDI